MSPNLISSTPACLILFSVKLINQSCLDQNLGSTSARHEVPALHLECSKHMRLEGMWQFRSKLTFRQVLRRERIVYLSVMTHDAVKNGMYRQDNLALDCRGRAVARLPFDHLGLMEICLVCLAHDGHLEYHSIGSCIVRQGLR